MSEKQPRKPLPLNPRTIQDGDSRKIVILALGADDRWELSRSGGGHGVLTWTPTGERIIFSIGRCDRSAWRHLADDIERVSGIVTRQRVKRRAREYKPPRPQPTRKPDLRAVRQRDAIRADIERAQREAARERLMRELMMPGD